ncbi:hypothetical protein EMCRGX_G015333 [Ephydatia muelleri]
MGYQCVEIAPKHSWWSCISEQLDTYHSIRWLSSAAVLNSSSYSLSNLLSLNLMHIQASYCCAGPSP